MRENDKIISPEIARAFSLVAHGPELLNLCRRASDCLLYVDKNAPYFSGYGVRLELAADLRRIINRIEKGIL